MSSKHEEDDLDLLLSLQDRVTETPPASPSHLSGHLSDHGSPKRTGPVDMSVFRNAVKDCLEDYEPKSFNTSGKKINPKTTLNHIEVEKFSGLRIRNQTVSFSELRDRFSDIRFVRLPTIKNLLNGDTLSGCWATVGILTEKGIPRTSSAGKSYCIWKIGSLNENTTSVFIFGNAYQNNSKEQVGTVFALFNSTVRKDTMGKDFSLSVYSANQILKVGVAADYGVCKGKRKDGTACTVVINKISKYCKYHKLNASEKYSTMRTELKGGNFGRVFRNSRESEGIFLVDRLSEKTQLKKSTQPKKLLSVEGLKKALSNPGKVTTNTHSQGIRCLAEITENKESKTASKDSAEQNQMHTSSEKREMPTVNQQMDAKRKKLNHFHVKKNQQDGGKMIELDLVSSDEEF